ncbi:hypothetical protein ANN_01814 [Periplaneta americana]|uniref:DCUN1 domain-containing protein n=1 Tax=Periplaneta americana TaxID=6978 RepID=A0ABQ8TYP3_PERAM|nr:hypothetical protein ANN_01814 [Periplaneta americana]
MENESWPFVIDDILEFAWRLGDHEKPKSGEPTFRIELWASRIQGRRARYRMLLRSEKYDRSIALLPSPRRKLCRGYYIPLKCVASVRPELRNLISKDSTTLTARLHQFYKKTLCVEADRRYLQSYFFGMRQKRASLTSLLKRLVLQRRPLSLDAPPRTVLDSEDLPFTYKNDYQKPSLTFLDLARMVRHYAMPSITKSGPQSLKLFATRDIPPMKKSMATGSCRGRQHSLKCANGKRSRPMCPVVQQEEVESIPASSYECTMVHCVLRWEVRAVEIKLDSLPCSEAQILRDRFQNVFGKTVDIKKCVNFAQVSEGVPVGEIDGVCVCDIPLFKYARLTSCDVERSFSQYKSLFRDNRHAFVMENLEMTFVVHCNSRPTTSTQVWLVST